MFSIFLYGFAFVGVAFFVWFVDRVWKMVTGRDGSQQSFVLLLITGSATLAFVDFRAGTVFWGGLHSALAIFFIWLSFQDDDLYRLKKLFMKMKRIRL